MAPSWGVFLLFLLVSLVPPILESFMVLRYKELCESWQTNTEETYSNAVVNSEAAEQKEVSTLESYSLISPEDKKVAEHEDKKAAEHEGKKAAEHEDKKAAEHEGKKAAEHEDKKPAEHEGKKPAEHEDKKVAEHEDKKGGVISWLMMWIERILSCFINYFFGSSEGDQDEVDQKEVIYCDSKLLYLVPGSTITTGATDEHTTAFTGGSATVRECTPVNAICKGAGYGLPPHVVLIRLPLILSSLLLAILANAIITYSLCKRPSAKEQMITQIEVETESATKAVMKALGDGTMKQLEAKLLGRRLDKYWFLGTLVVTTKALILNCQLNLEQEEQEINSFLKRLDHPHIQHITGVKYSEEQGKAQVIVSQPFWKKGSLRDIIQGVEHPDSEWADKYKVGGGSPLPADKVAIYGRQILDAMLYLYEQRYKGLVDFRPLGHVQTGNIYIESDNYCRLGGYENTLLGYRSHLYRDIQREGLFPDIDVIMFGHVMYEMCTGKELSSVVPEEDVLGSLANEYRTTLQYIFTKKRDGSRHGVSDIRRKYFGLISD